MGTNQNTPSVIASLMGFDGTPPQQQPVYRPQKVLSDNYLQKSASLVSQNKGSSKATQKSRAVSKKSNSRKNDSSKDGSSRYSKQRFHDNTQDLNLKVDNSRKSGEKRKLNEGIEEKIDSSELLNSRKNIGNVKYGLKPSFLLDSRTDFAWEFKKQLLERSKTSEFFQEFRSESKRISQLGTKVFISHNESIGKLPIFKRFNFSSNPDRKIKKMSKSDEKSNPGKQNDNVLASGDKNAKDGCFSCSSDASFEQDSRHENGFTTSNHMEIEDELSERTSEAYQPSPNSVLEPTFKEDNSSSSEYGENVSTDLHGLWMKLQILKSESEEIRSNPETIASSDIDGTAQDPKLVGCFGPNQSREFSYLIDMLQESGFDFNNPVTHFERSHSPERIINPLVFETLEKKYGKQPSWSNSDRRLLFDRINSGVSEILQPPVDFRLFSKPLRRRMSNALRDMVEEEVWRLLVSQETEANADLSEKAVGREPWMELGEEVGSIVKEVEGYLFDELVIEFIGI